jgi:hypothetical protein
MRLINVCGVVFAVALGCGSSGGIDSSKTLGSLSAADQMTECMDLASEFPPKTVSCGSAGSATVGTDPAKCSGSNFSAAPASCTVTVGQLEDCDAALYDGSAACSTSIPPACAPLVNAGSACE